MSSRFKPIPADEVADQYWSEELLYVKNVGAADARYVVDRTCRNTYEDMAPSVWNVGSYDYAILLED